MDKAKKPPFSPLDKLLKLDKSRVIKLQFGGNQEKLEAMGQESEKKAAKWVQEEGRQEREAEQKIQDNATDALWSSRKQVLTYKGRLVEEMQREMDNWADELPEGFNWMPQSTQKGIVLWIRNPQRDYYAKGLSLSYEPKYDLNGIARLIVRAVEEATKQATPKTDNGIITPYK